MIESDTWDRVNGELMRNFVRKAVSMIGKVQSVDSSGLKIKLNSSDNKSINVVLSEPLNDAVLNKWIEVIGVATSADSIKCEQVITFLDEEQDEDFDTTSHSLLVHFLNNDSESVFKTQ